MRRCPWCKEMPAINAGIVSHACELLGITFRVPVDRWHAKRKPQPKHVAEQSEMSFDTRRSPAQIENDRLLCALASVELGEPVSAVVGVDARRHAAALKVIRAFDPTVTVKTIIDRAAVYRARWPNVELTSNALAKWWSKLRSAPPKSAPNPLAHTAAQDEELRRLKRQYGFPEEGMSD